MCKLCDMRDYPKDGEIKYAESNNWICVGDKETGNPLIILKTHYINEIPKDVQKEGMAMFNLLVTKYWSNMRLTTEGEIYPHKHMIISEVK